MRKERVQILREQFVRDMLLYEYDKCTEKFIHRLPSPLTDHIGIVSETVQEEMMDVINIATGY